MRYLGYLIDEIRRESDNTDVSTIDGDTVTGIADEEIIQFINDAQDRLQNLISSSNSTAKIFSVSRNLSTVASQEEYGFTADRLLMNKEIELVEFSVDGLATNFYELDKMVLFNRDTTPTEFPYGYYTRFGKICSIPPTTSNNGIIRVTFERQIDEVDKRRGKITAVSGLSSTTFTNLTLDSTADETSNPNLSSIDYICICDKDGTVTAYNIPVLSYDTATNILTPVSTFTFQTGETIAIDSYVTFHKWSTTHSQLPDPCESYLIIFAVEKLMLRDSADDYNKWKIKREDTEKDLLAQINSQTSEVQLIPQFDWGEWYP